MAEASMDTFNKEPKDIWIAINYDGKLTGSLEHRQYNHGTMLARLLAEPEGALSPIGMYAKIYDGPSPAGGAKSKEPNFDGILAYIAILNDDIFNANFHYVPTLYDDHPQIDALTSGLSTSWDADKAAEAAEAAAQAAAAAGADKAAQAAAAQAAAAQAAQAGAISREGLYAITGIPYQNMNHVFILGPINQAIIDKIKKLKGHTVFHFQGDASSSKGPGYKTTSYPDVMTVYDGLFPVAFNFWTGENEARVIRQRKLMNQSYMVKCNSNIAMVEVLGKTLLNPGTDVQMPYPGVFQMIQEAIHMQQYLQAPVPVIPLFQPIRVKIIAEDLIDKDNLTACSILIKNSTIKPDLLLIGRRVYDTDEERSLFNFANYVFRVPGYPDLVGQGTFLPTTEPGGIPQPNWGWFQPCVPIKTSTGVHLSEIQFPAIKVDKAIPPNMRYNHTFTMKHHDKLCNLFMDALNGSGADNYKIPDFTSDANIVDGVNPVSNSLRSPFHENMMFKLGIVGLAYDFAKTINGGNRKRSKRSKKNKKTRRRKNKYSSKK